MQEIIRVYGIVQGVGFRPTVARHASEYNIKGTVCNKGPYVEIFAEGEEASLAKFRQAILERGPKRAVILKLESKELMEAKAYSHDGFEIIESEKTKGEILISPDIAICEDCKEELLNPSNKRYLHPFINCTCCGPRLTILDALPYDRERTSMKEFAMCPDCGREYVTPEDRRYDAQPVCCNSCGPVVYLLEQEESDLESLRRKQSDAITKIRRIIMDGGIVAVKGIGGYHLCCDARNEEAVAKLRARKHRPEKPLAVMAKDLMAAREYCEISACEEEILKGHQKPILLLKKKHNESLAPSVTRDNPKLGLMLPYAPVQILLFDYPDGIQMTNLLVMTSANESGAPICRSEEDARTELQDLCDGILAHNRKIRLRADDTVMDFYQDKPYMIRRSRGYAPLPFVVNQKLKEKKVVLGIGGELKNSFCIRVGDLCYMSPYIGDMEDIRTVNALKESIDRFTTLLEVKPESVICDLHPKYNTTVVAEGLGIPVKKIQHHYAHVLSCMAENNYLKPVIGLAFDGTGYGSDGSIWGGEFLLSDTEGFVRKASIEGFLQVGGNASAKEGWRIAASLLYEIYGAKAEEIVGELNLCSKEEARVLMKMHDMKMNAVESTSIGRLFDGVSALLGIRRASTFEGEGATSLQHVAETFEGEARSFALDIKEKDGRWIAPTHDLFKKLYEDKMSGVSVNQLAYEFHLALAELALAICQEIRKETGNYTVALTGGCYQNTLMLFLTEKLLTENQFTVLKHSLIPPNDGGIAMGQAIYTGK